MKPHNYQKIDGAKRDYSTLFLYSWSIQDAYITSKREVLIVIIHFIINEHILFWFPHRHSHLHNTRFYTMKNTLGGEIRILLFQSSMSWRATHKSLISMSTYVCQTGNSAGPSGRKLWHWYWKSCHTHGDQWPAYAMNNYSITKE